jgi:hypothetical protein
MPRHEVPLWALLQQRETRCAAAPTHPQVPVPGAGRPPIRPGSCVPQGRRVAPPRAERQPRRARGARPAGDPAAGARGRAHRQGLLLGEAAQQPRDAALRAGWPPLPAGINILPPACPTTRTPSPPRTQAWLDDRHAVAGTKCAHLLHIDTHTGSVQRIQPPPCDLPPRPVEFGSALGIQDVRVDPSGARLAIAGGADGRVGCPAGILPGAGLDAGGPLAPAWDRRQRGVWLLTRAAWRPALAGERGVGRAHAAAALHPQGACAAAGAASMTLQAAGASCCAPGRCKLTAPSLNDGARPASLGCCRATRTASLPAPG